jgi:uncharacterized protein involved in exopolysaccharide biosynthesis
MGKPERRMKRATAYDKFLKSAQPPTEHAQALSNLKALPELIQGIVDANKVLTEEQARLKEIIGDILQEHETQLEALKARLDALEQDK